MLVQLSKVITRKIPTEGILYLILFRQRGFGTLPPGRATCTRRDQVSFFLNEYTHIAHQNDRHDTRYQMRGHSSATGHLQEHIH